MGKCGPMQKGAREDDFGSATDACDGKAMAPEGVEGVGIRPSVLPRELDCSWVGWLVLRELKRSPSCASRSDSLNLFACRRWWVSGARAWARAVVRVVEDVGIELVLGVSGVIG